MDAQQIITAYEQGADQGADPGAEARAAITDPRTRYETYLLLQGMARRPHALIRALFEQEMLFRTALSERKVETRDENLLGGFYRCAFLLYEVRDPEDVFLLWRGKCMDMDAYCMMGQEYFVGAGIDETIAFLRQSAKDKSARDKASKILEYIEDSFSYPGAHEEQRQWEEMRRADPDNVWI